jgi:hypothetical protein
MDSGEEMTRPIDDLFYWVREREAVRVAKERGDPFPWTSDPIISKYRFCCVRREDDRVTRWIKENVRDRFAGNPNLWLMLAISRQINWPETLRVLISSGNYAWPVDEKFDPRILGEVLEGIAKLGKKVFTGAYIITAPSTKGAKKTTFVAEKTIGSLWRERETFDRLFAIPGRTMQLIHAALMDHDGWGPFLAYQAVVDIRFTPLLSSAPDVAAWAAAGPGTIRGLNRIAGRPVGAPLKQGVALIEMGNLFPKIKAETGVDLDFSDVPNVLCETDKYLRVKTGAGEPRALYVPGRGS